MTSTTAMRRSASGSTRSCVRWRTSLRARCSSGRAGAARRALRAVRRPRRPGHLAALAAGQDDPPVGKRYEGAARPETGIPGTASFGDPAIVSTTVLVVDDQDLVRDVIKLSLEGA